MDRGFDNGLVGRTELEQFDMPGSSHLPGTDPGRNASAAGAEQGRSGTPYAQRSAIDAVQRRGADEDEPARALARSWDLPFLEARELAVDLPALASLGPAQALALRAIPVGYENGTLRVAIDAPSPELFARVGEHYSDGVSFAVVTRATLDVLLAPYRSELAGQTDVADVNGADDTSLSTILSLLEDETSRIYSIREKLQRINVRLAEKDQRLARLEAELEQSRAQRRQDVASIARLHEDLAQRDAVLNSVRAKVREFAAVLDPSNRP